MKTQIHITVLVLSLLLFSSSCFKTRTVEPPGRDRSDWISPTDYQILLGNLKTAISTGNSQNFLRCFEDELEFKPAASLLIGNEAIWESWSKQDEQAWFENMLARLQAVGSLSLIEQDLQDVTADSLRYIGDYNLFLQHSDSTLINNFKGQLQLMIRINSFNEWSIKSWEDIETHQDSSWSVLKLKFVQ